MEGKAICLASFLVLVLFKRTCICALGLYSLDWPLQHIQHNPRKVLLYPTGYINDSLMMSIKFSIAKG